ncbi:MAG: hypothetical protein Q6363_000665 [Candidatus Njordarchaeota archaeon]
MIYNISDVFFEDDGNTICWNVTRYNVTFSQDENYECYINMTITNTLKVRAFSNQTLDLASDTTIEIVENTLK